MAVIIIVKELSVLLLLLFKKHEGLFKAGVF